MIESSEPRTAEYYRGYRLGIQFRQLGPRGDDIRRKFPLVESAPFSGDQYVDAFSRGYRDGCSGSKPSPRVTVPE